MPALLKVILQKLKLLIAEVAAVEPELEGIGFYEQIPKTGIIGASLAGGAEVVIYGQGMSHTPS